MVKRAGPKYTDDFYTDLLVGEILRAARVQMNLSVHDVEHMLRIRYEHLEALERSDFEALPGPAYVVGFVRTYAEFLNLDGGRVVDLLRRQSREGLGKTRSVNFVEPSTESRVPSVPVVGAAMAALVLVVVMWVAYQNMRLSGMDEFPAAPDDMKSFLSLERNIEEDMPRATDRAGTVEVPLAVPVANVPVVEIYLRDDSWIELRNPEGRVVDARLFRKGETIALDRPVDEFGNSYAVTMGNAAAVDIRIEGKSIGSFGQSNQVRRNIPLNPKTLELLVEKP